MIAPATPAPASGLRAALVDLDRGRIAFIIASHLDCTADECSITGIGEAADAILSEIDDCLTALPASDQDVAPDVVADDLVERLRGTDGCPFCGRDPYHYVDVGVGFQAVAVECCELGIGLFQHHDKQLEKEMELRNEAADALQVERRKCQEAEADAGRLEAELDEARYAPWPEWAGKVLAVIRERSGYDGYDDTSNGVDLPEELEEAIQELEATIASQAATITELRATVERAAEDALDKKFEIVRNYVRSGADGFKPIYEWLLGQGAMPPAERDRARARSETEAR